MVMRPESTAMTHSRRRSKEFSFMFGGRPRRELREALREAARRAGGAGGGGSVVSAEAAGAAATAAARTTAA